MKLRQHNIKKLEADIFDVLIIGGAYLAGLQKNIYPAPEEFAKLWKLERQFTPKLAEDIRVRKYRGWKDAVRRTLTIY